MHADPKSLTAFGPGDARRWRGRSAPGHRGRALPSTDCQALRAGHPADAADMRPRKQARASVCR